MKEKIKKRAEELGFDSCHITTADPPATAKQFSEWLEAQHHGQMAYLKRNAHKRTDPQQVLAGARSIICLAVSYANQTFSQDLAVPGGALVARYARYGDYHDIIGDRLKVLTAYVDELGGIDTRSLWYVDTGPFLERDLAQRSGLGFAGKHTNLISRTLGNWFFISEIVTTLPLEPDTPEKNRCGTCSRCISACPTAAITGPFRLDARRCISYLTIELKEAIPEELRPLLGNHVYGCDECLAVCPWNRFAEEGRLMRGFLKPDLNSPDLLELLALDDAGFKQRFKGTPILRTKRRGLLRNICVVLGNIGDVSVLPALERSAQDPEPLIAEHAQWAIRRIQEREGKAPS